MTSALDGDVLPPSHVFADVTHHVSEGTSQQTHQHRRNYGTIAQCDSTQPIRTRETDDVTVGHHGHENRGRHSPRARSAPIISHTPTASVTGQQYDDDIFSEPNSAEAGYHGFMDGMNVEITQDVDDMTTQNLPEALRHVMLHVIGSRPSEEVKFRRLKYRLEAGDASLFHDTTFFPRGRTAQRPVARRQQSWNATVSSHHLPVGSDRLESSISGPPSRQESRQGLAESQQDPTEGIDVVVKDTRVLANTSGRQKGILFVLAINELMASMSLSILAPFFPIVARNKGLSDAISGWVFGVFALVQCLASPIFGRVLPQVGAKFLSQSGQFFAGGCTVLFGMLQYVATEDGILLFITYCFVLRMFMAVGCAANGTAAFAIAARTFPDNPATIFGLIETAAGFGLMLGPALGGVLFEVGGFVLPFAVIGTAMVLSVPVGICVLPRDVIEVTRDTSTDSSVFDFLRIPAVTLTALAAFIACLAWVMPDPTLEPHLSQFHLSPTVIGMVFLLMAACYAICSPVWGWVADNVPDSSPMMVVGFVGTGLGFLILGPSPIFRLPTTFTPLWMNVIGLIVIGLSVSLALVPTYDKILDAAEKAGISDTLANCSTMAGIWNSAYCFGEFVGPVVAGWMMGKVGFPWTMSLASALCFMMAIAMLVLYIYERKFGPTGVRPSRVSVTSDDSQAGERTPLLDPIHTSA